MMISGPEYFGVIFISVGLGFLLGVMFYNELITKLKKKR